MTWLNEKSRSFLSKGYLAEGQTVEERIRQIAETAEKHLGIEGYADKIEDYILKGWIGLSSPVWANYGTNRGLPASCNSSLIKDNMDSILSKMAEIASMTKYGAGTSAYFGELRPRGAKISTGGESSGPVHFMELFDKITSVISQSSIRRGSMAAYLPVDHPDILEFLRIKSIGNPIQDLSIGVCISDKWMNDLKNKDKDKLKIWSQIIKKRFESGYPYLVFTDNANNNAPEVYKKHNKKIYSSNLCNEIMLSLEEDESYVCVLSSANLLHYDEWKNTDLIKVLTYFLDTVTTEYVEKTESIKFLKSAHNFAKRQRAIGLGVLGWHSYLQSKNIAFESMQAKFLNTEIFKYINEQTLLASIELAEKFGEPELMVGTGQRMATRMAVAPTTSNSAILGQISQGIEALNSNYFVKRLSKGNHTYKNPYLKIKLKELNEDTPQTWASILEHGGSVQHLSFLSDHDKEVFKTFGEISQKEIVIQAIQRQKYIDQGQSLNLMISPKTPPKDVSQLLIYGWENGIKGFYYQRGYNPSQELTRSILECKSCEG
jgi:ribonucleoside-diphosphate reductase alpha chain